MIVKSERTLAAFRGAGRCEFCGQWFSVRHPHHIFARGMGGGKRLDIRINLVSLCPGDHAASHDGHEPRRQVLLQIAAAREGCTWEEAEQEIRVIMRAPK